MMRNVLQNVLSPVAGDRSVSRLMLKNSWIFGKYSFLEIIIAASIGLVNI
jgi:hypothetical protein